MSKKRPNQPSITGFFSKNSKISLDPKPEIHENLAENQRSLQKNDTKI